jgi:hypothetical protein
MVKIQTNPAYDYLAVLKIFQDLEYIYTSNIMLMFFNLFKKKEDSVVFNDKIYMSSSAKKNAIVELGKNNPNILFIAWFAETAIEYRNIFIHHGLPENRIAEARALHTGKIESYIPVFLEHFPLHAKEAALVKNWNTQKIDCYNTLEEPMFNQLGAERIIALMKQMGMKEDEMMEHPLISKAIRNAQEKIAQKLDFEQSAHSQEDWIQKNIK